MKEISSRTSLKSRKYNYKPRHVTKAFYTSHWVHHIVIDCRIDNVKNKVNQKLTNVTKSNSKSKIKKQAVLQLSEPLQTFKS